MSESSAKLDRFLTQAISDLTGPKPMNKFAELAAKMKANRKAMDEEADKLNAEMDKVMPQFMEAVDMHRDMLGEARAGVEAMKEAASGMIGHNSRPNEPKDGESS